MPAVGAPRLDLAELGRLLRAADPAALLVPPRVLRRVIKYDRGLAGFGLRVPHRKSYVIGRDALLTIADRAELGVKPDRDLPAELLLLERPEPDRLAALSRDAALSAFWRLLFHAGVHRAVARRGLSAAAARERIHRIGQVEFNEVRTVLRQERLLLPPRDDRTAYEEFAALYLELRYFAAPLLPRYFPGGDFARIDAVLAEDVDAAALFAAARPAGAPDPVCDVDAPAEGEVPDAPTRAPRPPALSEWRAHDLAAAAERAMAAGNVVRAAVWRARAAAAAPRKLADKADAHAAAALDRLVARLRPALHLTDAEVAAWQHALPALLPGAARGLWPAEARLLYDLQKVCLAAERPAAAADFAEWAYAGFRGPLVRPLPDQPLVQAVRYLRRAVNRLPAARLNEAERHELSELLHAALDRAADRLRDRFRPLIADALADVGLRPANFAERVARDQLVEELLDRIVERGFLNLGDLRDAVARNQLKLDDLSGPVEWLTGDALLRANRALARRAPGVYRRGEVYLRALQRLSAAAFGTRPGRWLTRFVAMPFGGAYATVVFAQEMLHLVRLPHHLEPAALGATVGLLGTVYLLLLHVAAVRQAVMTGLRAAGSALRTVFVDWPAAVLRLPAVRWLLESRSCQFVAHLLLKPLPVGVLAGLVLWWLDVGPFGSALGAAATFAVFSLLFNSRLGRDLEEAATDWVGRRWDFFRDFVPGVIGLVMDIFRSLLEGVERALYAVDEWLRFRGGDGRWKRAVKAVFGFVWLVVAYVVRLYVNVLIEPTVNPVKHFPAVTVAAKLLVPFWIPLTELFATPLMFLGAPLAYGIAFLNVHALPGAAGFLVWEFKENWRLYRANRPRTLRPSVIGHHGETVLRLLKPGVHSGTLPKLFAKLRRAERRAHRGGDWRPARRLREQLHHVEERVRHFAERELLAYLNGSRGWGAGPIHLTAVEAGSNRLRLVLACPGLGEEPLEVAFEQQSGWLLADMSRPGWRTRLSPDQAAVLTAALVGFCKLAGVDLLRERIAACFAPHVPPYDIADEGLVVWPGGGYDTEAVYDLRAAGPEIRPHIVEGGPVELPVLSANDLLFERSPVTWADWVVAWDLDQSGQPMPLAAMRAEPNP